MDNNPDSNYTFSKDKQRIEDDVQNLIDYKVNNSFKTKIEKMKNKFQKTLRTSIQADELLMEHQTDKKLGRDLERYCNSVIDWEMKRKQLSKIPNFAFIYNQNLSKSIYIFPRISYEVTLSPKKNGKSELTRFANVFESDRYLINPYEEGNSKRLTSKKIESITDKFLEEGKINRDIIPGPYREPLFYLVVAGAFFYKFISKLPADSIK